MHPHLSEVSSTHKDAMLTILLHVMDQTTRRRVMAEAPAAYNAVFGREIVTVVRAMDGSKL